MNATTTAPKPSPPPASAHTHAPAINIHFERCDRCRHRAYVATLHGVGRRPLYLTWCHHHHEENLSAGRVNHHDVIIDARDQLVARETGVHA